MKYAITRLNKRQSEAIQQIFNLQSPIFNSGLPGLGFTVSKSSLRQHSMIANKNE